MAWLENLYQQNDINIVHLLAWTRSIAERKRNKINTLILQGPTGTGKSLTLNTIFGQLNTGIVTRSGDQTQFHLQNLLDKSFALFEEPRISPATVDDFKLLFGGEKFEVLVKHSEPENLKRIPVFVSTNKDIGYWISPADTEALNSRTKTFYLKKEIKGWSDRPNQQSLLDPPPGTITSDDFLGLYHKYQEQINTYIQDDERGNTKEMQ